MARRLEHGRSIAAVHRVVLSRPRAAVDADGRRQIRCRKRCPNLAAMHDGPEVCKSGTRHAGLVEAGYGALMTTAPS